MTEVSPAAIRWHAVESTSAAISVSIRVDRTSVVCSPRNSKSDYTSSYETTTIM